MPNVSGSSSDMATEAEMPGMAPPMMPQMTPNVMYMMLMGVAA